MYEISLKINSNEADELVEKLQMADIFNVYYEQPFVVTTDNNGYGYYEEDDTFFDLKVIVENDEDLDFQLEIIKNTLNRQDLEVKKVTIDAWQQPFEAVDLNNGYVIGPENYETDKKLIKFESQGAFGTGLHETTQDCLRIILEEDFSNKYVMDLGTGSGILSFAAALKNAEEITAIDIRDVHEEINYNAALNHIDNIKIVVGNILEEELPVRDSFDYVFINIGGDETLMMLPYIHSRLKPEGKLLLSGLVEWGYKDVVDQICKMGYEIIKQCQTNEWVTLLLNKNCEK